MSLNEIDNFVLIFPDENWSSLATNTQLTSVISQLSPNVSYAETLTDNIRTLSTHNADASGAISGLLYVPDLDEQNECYNTSKAYVPTNVTRQSNLPATDFTLIALAPWINVECTLGFLAAARQDPTRAFIFYSPDNSTERPPPISSEQWSLQDGGSWKAENNYPVYAVPGSVGARMMHELSLYSGNLTDVPYGHQISTTPGVDPRDYVRIYTQLDVSQASSLPNLWEFLLIIVALLAVMLAATSGIMHYIQRNRRLALRRRVETGEVNLEALGIKRLNVPQELIDRMPLFRYYFIVERLPPIPKSPADTTSHSEQDSSNKETYAASNELAIDAALSPTSSAPPTSDLDHKLVSYSQPTCPICLDDFEIGATLVRELPCGHIFHPDCIDPFLANNSSLCPMCKKSVLPIGHCPTNVTNAMVTRERNMRRLRSRITIHDDQLGIGEGNRRTLNRPFGSTIMRRMFNSATYNVQMSSAAATVPGAGAASPITTNAIPPRLQDSPTIDQNLQEVSSREERVQQRIMELAAQQPVIEDPDVIIMRQQPAWRRALVKAFPGFS